MQKFKISLIFLITAVSININAQIVTERPTQSESSSVLPKGSFQIETGIVRQISGNDLYPVINVTSPITLFRFGLTKRVELRLLSQYRKDIYDYPYYSSSKTVGFSDIEVGTKIQIFKKENAKTEIAFETHLSVPTGSALYTNGTYATINKIAVSHVLTDKLGLGYNIGYIYNGNGESSMLYSIGLGYNVNNKFGFFIEPYGNLAEFSTHTASINSGIFFLLKKNFQVDFSLGTGINHPMNFVAMGLAWLIDTN
ncbi:MAG: transporter [Bacteroidales bacterium]|nr:transporter [Bacteroidales bacterium]